jgi:hypothetical protein
MLQLRNNGIGIFLWPEVAVKAVTESFPPHPAKHHKAAAATPSALPRGEDRALGLICRDHALDQLPEISIF